jgi:WD40 repeat protein
VHLYELERGQRPRKIADLDGHEGEINSIKFSNHGDRIVSGGKVSTAPSPSCSEYGYHLASARYGVPSHGVGWRLCS